MTIKTKSAVSRAVRFVGVVRFFNSIKLQRKKRYRWYEVEHCGM